MSSSLPRTAPSPRLAAAPILALAALSLLALPVRADDTPPDSGGAGAPGPTATISEDGSVLGVVVVATAPAQALARVNDPGWIAEVGDPSTRVTVAATEGACQVLDYVSDHTVATARYRVRQCLVDGGNDASLVESASFSSYRTSWRVEPAGTGSRLTYRLDLVSTLAVPKWIVRRASRGSVQRMLEALAENL